MSGIQGAEMQPSTAEILRGRTIQGGAEGGGRLNDYTITLFTYCTNWQHQSPTSLPSEIAIAMGITKVTMLCIAKFRGKLVFLFLLITGVF